MTGKVEAHFFKYCGHRLLITNIFDVDGDETKDPGRAHKLIAMLPDGRWIAAMCSPDQIETTKLN